MLGFVNVVGLIEWLVGDQEGWNVGIEVDVETGTPTGNCRLEIQLMAVSRAPFCICRWTSYLENAAAYAESGS